MGLCTCRHGCPPPRQPAATMGVRVCLNVTDVACVPAAELFVRRLASRIAARIAQAGLSRPGQDDQYVPASNFMVPPAGGSTADARLQSAPAWLQAFLLELKQKQ
jgi:hypothetical protein